MGDDAFGLLGEAREAELISQDLVELLVERAHAAAHQKRLSTRAVTVAVDSAARDMLSVVQFYFRELDEGEPMIHDDPSWRLDAEPQAVAIDTWSRGAVQLKTRATFELQFQEPAQTPRESLPSRGSARSRVRTPRNSRPVSRDPATDNPAAKKDDIVHVFAKKAADSAESPEPIPRRKVDAQPIVTSEELTRMRREKQEKDIQDRLEQIKTELKGREYTSDANGAIIPIEPLRAERLPPYALMPRLAMLVEEDAMPPQGKRKGPGAGGKGGAGAAGAGKRRGAAASLPTRPEFSKPAGFKRSESLQPPLLETVALCEGVTLHEGEGSKSGATRKFNHEHMSRKDFETFMRTSAGGARGISDGTSGLSDDPAAGAASATDDMAGEAAPELGNAVVVDRSDPNDINLKLMAHDWGVNPVFDGKPKLAPVPPATAERELQPPLTAKSLGARARAPRERAGTAVCAHLPPPMLPATAGHGLVSYEGQPLWGDEAPPQPPLGGGRLGTVKAANSELLKQVI